MADFLSKFTGQQIENILSSVEGKVNKNDIVDNYVEDPESPASARLAYDLDSRLKKVNQDLSQKYMRIDEGDQEVNGRKKFNSRIDAQEGIAVADGRYITLTTEPTMPEHVVNLSFLRKHGVGEDTASNTSGLEISILANGYNALKLNIARLTNYTGTDLPLAIPVNIAGNQTRSWTIANLFTSIFADNRFNNYVKVDSYTTDMQAVSQSIGQRVLATDYAQDQINLTNTLAGKASLSKTGTVSVPISGSAAITTDFDHVNCISFLATATWGTVRDVYRFTVGYDGTVKSEILVQKSTAGVVTCSGSIVSNKLRITFSNANTTTVAVVDYQIAAIF